MSLRIYVIYKNYKLNLNVEKGKQCWNRTRIIIKKNIH